MAQDWPYYRIVRMGPPSGPQTRAYGLNEHGHVVGVVIEDDTGNPEWAFVWMLENAYGFTGVKQTLVELYPVTTDWSLAREINDAGLVVGRVGDSFPTRAYVWELESGSISSLAVGVSGFNSEAWGVNDFTDPLVVGETRSDSGDCFGGVRRGFEAEIDLSPLGLSSYGELDPAADEDDATGSFDVNNASTPVETGYQLFCGRGSSCASTNQEAALWDGSPPALLSLGDFMGQNQEGRGINDAGNVVGWGIGTVGGVTCVVTSLYWENAGSMTTPVHLGAALGSGAIHSQAEAINEDLYVVGWDSTSGIAILWEVDSTVYATDLNDTDVTLWCGEEERLKLVEAHDINDEGWIVGLGRYPSSTESHGFLLIPRNDDCLGDTNWDGVIDVDDLVAVLADWGSCDSGDACLGDIDFDCDVDSVDYAYVNDDEEDWGPCGGESLTGGMPGWIATVLDAFESGALSAQEALAIIEAYAEESEEAE